MKRSGFTFVEVTAAVAIGAFVVVVAVGALKSVSDGTQTVRQHSELAAELRFVTDRIRQDLDNLYRDGNHRYTKLRGGQQWTGSDAQGALTFYTLLHQKARASAPESDVYEVEYSLMEREGKSLFFRRVWPNPDKDRDPGGVLTVLSTRIIDFHVRFLDGEEWVDQWSEEENRKLPELIEVQVVARWDERHRPVGRNIFVSLARGDGVAEDFGEEEGNGN